MPQYAIQYVETPPEFCKSEVSSLKCGFTRIKLGGDDSLQTVFTFKVGDRVQTKMSKVSGLVLSGDCYRSAERPDQIFYAVSMPDGKVWTLRQEDLELPPGKDSLQILS